MDTPAYRVRFQATINLDVLVHATDEDGAADSGWELANAYANTVFGDGQGVTADVSLDGVGAYAVEVVEP